MSEFAVTLETIENISRHPNADRLELATMKGLGFQLVVEKGIYKPGQSVVYFPVDSLIPQNLITQLNINYLAGSEKNRVKTVKLRGEYAQGLAIPASEIFPAGVKAGVDITSVLGVTKYEAPIKQSSGPRGSTGIPLPDHISFYDIESAQRNIHIVDILSQDGVRVHVTEKLEGTHFAVCYTPPTDPGAPPLVQVCSRNQLLERKSPVTRNQIELTYTTPEGETKTVVRNNAESQLKAAEIYGGNGVFRFVARDDNKPKTEAEAEAFADLFFCHEKRYPDKYLDAYDANKEWLDKVASVTALTYHASLQVILRAELIGPGIQDNIYKLEKPELRIFDIEVDRKYLPPQDALHVMRLAHSSNLEAEEHMVPTIFEGTVQEFLSETASKDLVSASNGTSLMRPTLREGIVLKPTVNMFDSKIGRVILKVRSPEYLSSNNL